MEQPPHEPLISAHPIQSIFELGLADVPPPNQVLSQSFSLLLDTPSGKFHIAGNGYIFSRDVDDEPESNWYSHQELVLARTIRSVLDPILCCQVSGGMNAV
ncbi:hypothetical protein NLI96_g11378 [Meripilus lineatus]|uniref:Uncharacterized protein n=1 Tax=Meripilus lineatus TaxID=2056292 RepID=A0AAD5URW0_9APHY|nr:hypothetical protein NLI96_g11378 [Physisporinus lineatus]